MLRRIGGANEALSGVELNTVPSVAVTVAWPTSNAWASPDALIVAIVRGVADQVT